MSLKVFKMKNLILTVIIVFATLFLYQIYNNSVDTEIAEVGSLNNEVSTKGIAVKDEYVLGAKCSGTMKYFYEDDDRVIKGRLIAELYTNDSSESIKNEIDQINIAIDNINKNSQISSSINESEITNVEDNIQQCILSNDIQNIYNIYGTYENETYTSEDSKYNGYTLNELNKFKDDYTKALENNKITYYSPVTGLVSSKIDGYENLLDYNKVLELTPNVISNIINSDSSNSDNADDKSLDNHVKVTRNFKYYIACKVSNDNVQLFTEGKYVKVKFKCEDNANEQLVYGWIEKINYGSEESAIIISFDDFFYLINEKRIVDIGLITDTYEGLKISKKSIIIKDGIEGVYIKDISNIIKFMPIHILGSNDDIAIIDQGQMNKDGSRGTIIINDNTYSTVKTFDKVVLNPDKVYEGQIAN